MAGGTFTAQLEAFRDMTVQNMRYVASQAIQDVVEAAQQPQVGLTRGATSVIPGKIPVGLTGNLRRSLVSEGRAGQVAGETSYSAIITGFEVGDVMRFAWTAEYALPVELGHNSYPGAHFVGLNAARFSEFVEARAAEVRR